MHNQTQAIKALQEFARHKYAWPGGYPLFAITNDGGCLCHKCVKDNYRLLRESQRNYVRYSGDGWQVEAIDINWEDTLLYCDNCGKNIESAYGE
jgi:hypothetical protein